MKIMNIPTVNELFTDEDILMGGVFAAIGVTPMWAADDIPLLGIDFHYNHIASALASPILKVMWETNDYNPLVDSQKENIGKIIKLKFLTNWEHLWRTYNLEYNPLTNVSKSASESSTKEGETSGTHETAYGKVDTASGTDSTTGDNSSDTIFGGSDTLSKTGTRTLTDGGTDTDTRTFGKTLSFAGETTVMDENSNIESTTGQYTDTQTGSIDAYIQGFNSGDYSPSARSTNNAVATSHDYGDDADSGGNPLTVSNSGGNTRTESFKNRQNTEGGTEELQTRHGKTQEESFSDREDTTEYGKTENVTETTSSSTTYGKKQTLSGKDTTTTSGTSSDETTSESEVSGYTDISPQELLLKERAAYRESFLRVVYADIASVLTNPYLGAVY